MKKISFTAQALINHVWGK